MIVNAGQRFVRVAIDVGVPSAHIPVPSPTHIALGEAKRRCIKFLANVPCGMGGGGQGGFGLSCWKCQKQERFVFFSDLQHRRRPHCVRRGNSR